MDADGGHAEGGGDVLGAAVIADIEVRRREDRREFGERDAADKAVECGAAACVFDHLLGKGRFVGAADDDEAGVCLVREQIDERGEGGGGPTAAMRSSIVTSTMGERPCRNRSSLSRATSTPMTECPSEARQAEETVPT